MLAGILLIVISMSVMAKDKYMPKTGDADLDSSLITLNKKVKNRKLFVIKTASEFQIQEEKITELFKVYMFTVADVLMTASITDISGQPVSNVARAYFENKNLGWKYTLEQMNVTKDSASFEQLKKDATADYMLPR